MHKLYPPLLLGKRYKNDGKAAVTLNEVQKNAIAHIKQKIITGEYIFEQVICPICEHTEYVLLAEKERYGLPCSIVICKNCGLILRDVRLSKTALNRFYAEDYRELFNGTKTAQDTYFLTQINRGKDIMQYIIKSSDIVSFRDLFVLEAGCGAGGILSAFRDDGAEILGLDLGVEYLEYGIKNHNLNLKEGSIQDYTGKKPDLIIYNMVLDHIADVTNELLAIKRICHEKTLIYVMIPGLFHTLKGYGDFLLKINYAAAYYFSLGTLVNIFEKYGFSLVCGDETIRALFITGHKRYINYYKANSTYLKNIEYIS